MAESRSATAEKMLSMIMASRCVAIELATISSMGRAP